MPKLLTRSLLALVLLLPLLYVAAGFLLARGKVLDERHTDFDEPAFDFRSDSFEDYIMYSKARLLAARTGPLDAEILENLAPFEFAAPEHCARGADGKVARGIVLTHGLLESAFSMRDLGAVLQAQCFHVLGLLLPDHGSRPGDFLSTDWRRYSDAVAFAARALAGKAEQIVLGGHSVGGALSILEATRNPQVDALVLFAPALAITDAARFARFIVPLGKLFPGAAWVGVDEDEALYRYESLTFTAAEQSWALIQAVHAAENARVQALPVFTVAVMEDSTVGTQAILDFMGRNGNAASRTLLYSQQSFTPTDARVTVLPAEDRAAGILGLSHLGPMTPPTNPYYGRNGAYRNCGHYGGAANPDFVACKQGRRDWYGETTAANRQQGLLERIAFNPYHESMTAELSAFLQAL